MLYREEHPPQKSSVTGRRRPTVCFPTAAPVVAAERGPDIWLICCCWIWMFCSCSVASCWSDWLRGSWVGYDLVLVLYLLEFEKDRGMLGQGWNWNWNDRNDTVALRTGVSGQT